MIWPHLIGSIVPFGINSPPDDLQSLGVWMKGVEHFSCRESPKAPHRPHKTTSSKSPSPTNLVKEPVGFHNIEDLTEGVNRAQRGDKRGDPLAAAHAYA
jgi:hypothetical protein